MITISFADSKSNELFVPNKKRFSDVFVIPLRNVL